MNDKKEKNQFVQMEEEVLKFWDKAKIFKKSVDRPASQGEYVFYDGPPFGTGEPHYGHILSSVAKDVVPRYFTMKGYRVARRWGWDCHGLPIENIIEKEMGLSGKKQIEEIGIAKFNEACRSQVLKYADIWDVMVRRIGRWVDFKNSYKTMDAGFMESVWWGFGELWKKGLVYEGRKVLLYCPRCETPISNFEVAMDNSYKDIEETSVYVKFKVKDRIPAVKTSGDNYILAWTTTPWTLPGNVALAVGNSIKYKVLSIKGMEGNYILANDRMGEVLDGMEYEIVSELTGKDLVGLSYEPLFDVPVLRDSGKEKVYTVQAADFVTTEDGTGVVHTAVVYGEDDYNLGQALDLPVIPALDEKGHFNETVPAYQGMYFKKANKQIIEDLKAAEKLFKEEKIVHSYPHCHRCDTQLFYNAIPAWFIDIAKLRGDLIAQNENINWYPAHLKAGRFRKGLENAPDWNITRNRYFATPIPIWKCAECGSLEVVPTVKDLEAKVDLGSFYIMRHGEAQSNVERRLCSTKDAPMHLTENGKQMAAASVKELKDKGIDLIISSDLVRTRETAEIAAQELGIKIVYDERLREVDTGDCDGKTYDECSLYIENRYNGQDIAWPNGESWSDIKQRIASFYNDLRLDYRDKKVLVISHGDPLLLLEAFLAGEDYLSGLAEIEQAGRYVKKAEVRELKHRLTDIHSHFVDGLGWPCQCGGEMRRISEVFDCWVESGSMAFAEHHYMGKPLPHFDPEKGVRFPAQYISEYISQTRAWFYVMHVMSVALFGKNSYENVVTTGVVLNEQGEKMSKSKKNYPDPWKVIDAYGVDALRMYLMSSTIMHAENLFFNEKELLDLFRKNIMLLWNVFKFYEMFAQDKGPQSAEPASDSSNILDKWILARLSQLGVEVSESMDGYDLPRASRPIGEFIDDLSTWYLRRSRDRFKGEDASDKAQALNTTRYVLLELSKIMAPFMPFMAETLWQKISGYNFQDNDKSVHLEQWTSFAADSGKQADIIKGMELTRAVVEAALAKRDEEKIKIRQPLAKATVSGAELPEDYAGLIKDEINVKELFFVKGGELKVDLDTLVTGELAAEGRKREIVRNINGLRKKQDLTISDKINILWSGGPEIAAVFKAFSQDIKRETIARDIVYTESLPDGAQFNINGVPVVLALERP